MKSCRRFAFGKAGRGLSLHRLLMSLIVSASLQPAFGQEQTRRIDYDIPFHDVTPSIDGVFDAAEWQVALRVDLVNETNPGQNIAAPVQTAVYVMEDGENFLVAFVAQDPEPDKIRAFYRDRDRAWQDDIVGVVIDTFNDERRAFEFFVNALGVQIDAIQDDVARREDDSWNALWDSAGTITDFGFVVEMRIPLKQLRFPSGLDKQTWGIDLLRFWPRDVRHRISNNFSDYSVSCYVCQFKKAQGFADLEQATNLQVIPTMTSLWSERRPQPATDAWIRDDPEFEAGADLRWGINEDMILNATLNPDFSQVEADQAQLDVNNTFSLFFPERREFFLDGADYFQTATTNFNTNNAQVLVHTRNIHSPDYGLKLTGKSGDHTYGMMVTNDERTNFLIPGNQGSRSASLADTESENLALRYRYDLGRNVTLGSIATRRAAEDYENTLVGTDLNWRFGSSDRIVSQLNRSRSEYPLAIQNGFAQLDEMADTAWSLVWIHQGENWRWTLSNYDFGQDFRADLGFINRVNYREQVINPGYTWRPAPGTSPIRAYGVWAQWDKSWDQGERELEEENRVGAWFDGPLQSYVEVNGGTRQRFFNGRYFDERTSGIYGQFQPWGGARFQLNVNGGRSIDFANTQEGDILTIAPSITMQFGRHMQTQLNYNRQTLDVAGGRLFTTDLVDLRLTWQFDNRSFVRAIFIDSDTERDPMLYRNAIDARTHTLNTQLLYSYRFNAQTRFFIGYADSALQGGALQDLEATNHTVFAKFSYAWQY